MLEASSELFEDSEGLGQRNEEFDFNYGNGIKTSDE